MHEGKLDITVVARPETDGDTEDKDDSDGDEEEEEDETLGDEDGSVGGNDVDQFNIPVLPLWFINAITLNLWSKATPSQRAAVEQRKNAKGQKAELSDGEMDDDEKRAKRLHDLLRLMRFDNAVLETHHPL